MIRYYLFIAINLKWENRTAESVWDGISFCQHNIAKMYSDKIAAEEIALLLSKHASVNEEVCVGEYDDGQPFTNEFTRCRQWFETIAQNSTDTIARAQNSQLAVFFEEVWELAHALLPHCDLTQWSLEELCNFFKNAQNSYLCKDNTKDVLDALGDIQVTLIGSTFRFGFNIEKILAPINESNYSKFIDGKPIFNEFGKVIKGKDYLPPDLSDVDKFKLGD